MTDDRGQRTKGKEIEIRKRGKRDALRGWRLEDN